MNEVGWGRGVGAVTAITPLPLRSSPGLGRVLAIANRKGGTGKSTTVVNLAAEWAARGRRVLVVDLDAQGHAGLGLGRLAARGGVTAHDCLKSRTVELASGIMATVAASVDLLPADREFDGDIHVSSPRRLAEALAPLKPRYDVILIDTPPSLPRLIVAALMAADAVVVPTMLDHLSLDGTGQFLAAYHRVVADLRADLIGALVVPTRVDMRSSMQQTVLARLINRFGASQIAAGVRVDVALPEAFGARKPVRLSRPSARAVADFSRLADAITWRFAWTETAASG